MAFLSFYFVFIIDFMSAQEHSYKLYLLNIIKKNLVGTWEAVQPPTTVFHDSVWKVLTSLTWWDGACATIHGDLVSVTIFPPSSLSLSLDLICLFNFTLIKFFLSFKFHSHSFYYYIFFESFFKLILFCIFTFLWFFFPIKFNSCSLDCWSFYLE